ncbi:hypothetical protein A2W14_03340 [Candidatus Gottesmanbacteria bacterium RBG_16_37_8]|uniref:Type II secretion system protein GspF domain-containing protein n=1 Tax=Candidatus Gottesmanbacteria bacterium RBG_16_37_8 TaxID=1798371 RepID=A0A1F5YTZ9_9BACT|nr:MAG: hypothetical protein A2W14_03340 [Candidatus Gottesmanbacteria bacterium RBG_16_37_8]
MIKSKIILSGNEKISFLSNLSTMLTAGISILEAIDALLEDAKGKNKKFLEIIREDIVQGNHLYYSFDKFPHIFDAITVNLIRAAEEAGTLEITLKDMRISIQKEMEFSDKVKQAMIYPILIGFVFLGVLLLMLVVVVPKISDVFLRLKVDLPLPTQVLIFSSNFFLKNTLYIILTIFVSTLAAIFIYRRNKSFIIAPLYGLPFISTLIKEIDLTRFTRSMALLLHAGVPILSCLELTKNIVINREMAKMIAKSSEMVTSGKKLSEGFKQSKGTFPSIMIKLMEVGEKSGALEKSMQDISEYLEYQVSNTLRTFTALLEPVMLLIVGVLVGGMMLAIIAPIYGLIGQVGVR